MAIDPRTQSTQSTGADPLRVLVIDAHPAVGLGLIRLVGIMPGLQTWGLASGAVDGVEQASATRPDVVLVDAELPDGAALATIRQLRACLPLARIIALGLYPDRRAAMLAAGAHAFALKDAGFDALRAAIVAGPASGHVGQASSLAAPASGPLGQASDPIPTAICESASARTPRSVVPGSVLR
jgi:DNA-binding NarL/FixJ family response regulator